MNEQSMAQITQLITKEWDLSDVIACRIHSIGHFQELHDPVQQAMDDLKSGRGVVENSREVSLIAGANLGTSVAQHNVTDFKELQRQGHLRKCGLKKILTKEIKCHLSVSLDCLKKSGH